MHLSDVLCRRVRDVSRSRSVHIGLAGALLAVACLAPLPTPTVAASQAQGNAYNYSPSSRTVAPAGVQSTSGSVTPQTVPSSTTPVVLSGINSYIVLDFGKEVGGLTTLTFAGSSSTGQQIGLAFSESSSYVGTTSDASSGASSSATATDGALYTTVNGPATYTTPVADLRGGFRYLTIFMATTGWVDLSGVSLDFTAAPGVSNPQAYANYFYSNDSLLNQIWYAGAYTVQLNTIDPAQGRVWPAPSSGWQDNATVGVGTSVLVDGAKRDRTVWPGDLGISLPTAYVSTDDLQSAKNALTTLYQHQDTSTGELPFAGPDVDYLGSDTYHMWTLLGTASYYTYSADKTWLDTYWNQYKHGMSFILAKIDSNGLLNVTGTSDWARSDQGGENIEANAILYETLTRGVQLATAENDSTDATAWQNRAATLKSAANSHLWNPTVGLYRDNPSSTLYPQDGNSLAVWFGLTDSHAKAASIVQRLAARWNNYGAVTPEKDNGGDIATFPGSMEVQAHFAAGDDINALALIRREWGYMLDSPLGTKSTFWEGYKADGTFDYGGPYMSAAHGWATGPTSALTFYVLGLAPISPGGQYNFIPHPGDLTHVEGDITMPQGPVSATWDYSALAGTFTENLTSPAGTTGTIGIPTYGSSNVSVTVNGATVWSSGTFTSTAGVSGGSADGAYVYLTGVAPGTYTVSASGVQAPIPFATSVSSSQLPAGYTLCATESGTCTPTGTQVMAFGAGSYLYKVVSGGTKCSTSTFDGADPAYLVLKSCYLAPAGGPAGYSLCASDGGSCSFSGTREVAYGVGGAFRFQVATGGVACNASAFDADPLPGIAKNCYLAPIGGPPGNWSSCASENNSCAVVGVQPMLFGANGGFWSGASNGTTTCSSGTFGVDPIYGVAKTCYSWKGAPPGYPTSCAAESGTCAFTGQKTVAFGADGEYIYKTFTGGTACTTSAFGADPLYGVVKACYLTS